MTSHSKPKTGSANRNKRHQNPYMSKVQPRKTKIKAALREQVWLRHAGPTFKSKCQTRWCQNEINVFNFQCGHVQAESKGGQTTVENLIPLCSRCNLSMGTLHMDSWNELGGQSQQQPTKSRFTKLWNQFKSIFKRK